MRVLALAVFALVGAFPQPTAAQSRAPIAWDRNATLFWTTRSMMLAATTPADRPFDVRRLNLYLAMAQYRAADSAAQVTGASVPAAITAASADVLASWFPDSAAGTQSLRDASASAPWAGTSSDARATGGAIGTAIAARVLRWSESDGTQRADPVAARPATAGSWSPGGRPPIRALYRLRLFVLPSDSVLRPPRPPAEGSPAHLAALREVRQFSDTRTRAQDSIAKYWNAAQSGRSDATYGATALELIRTSPLDDRRSAETLFRLSLAATDALTACFDAKYHYWFPRPSQVDAGITLPIGLPPHPSYPSAHSCASAASSAVLSARFPAARARLAAMREEASMSRLYAGIHYRFDMDAGHALGNAVAKRVLAAKLTSTALLPR